MLEWYEAYADYRDTMERMERLLESVALEVTGTTKTTRGHEVDLRAPWRRLRFHRLARRAWPGSATRPSCAARWTSAASTRTPTRIGPSWSTTRSATSSSRASAPPTIVHDYPIEISPFARTTDGDETLTERFEYFAGGMSSATFSEINDSEEQRASASCASRSTSRASRRIRLRRGALVRDAADRWVGLAGSTASRCS